MNTIEEQLWDYIDGNCSIEERLEIEEKIKVNLQYLRTYEELLAVHQELNKLDLEEPSMSFTRNVMEQVAVEIKPVSLKTKVDQRIIYGIAAFFIFSLLCIFGYALATSKATFSLPKVVLNFDPASLFNPIFLKVFLIVDLVLGLLYLDSFLRKRKAIN